MGYAYGTGLASVSALNLNSIREEETVATREHQSIMDIFNLLKEDHGKVKNLFQKLEKTEKHPSVMSCLGSSNKSWPFIAILKRNTSIPPWSTIHRPKPSSPRRLRNTSRWTRCSKISWTCYPDDKDWDEILKELNRLVERHVAEEVWFWSGRLCRWHLLDLMSVRVKGEADLVFYWV
jgi:hypothetical protein